MHIDERGAGPGCPGPADGYELRKGIAATTEGCAELRRRLAEPDAADIPDENRWFTFLALLRHLDDPSLHSAVLRRRLAVLEEPTSFFHDGDRPLGAEELDDRFRRGFLTIAPVTTRAELGRLRSTLDALGS